MTETEKLFSKIGSKDRFEMIKNEITELISQYKEDEKIFSDDTTDEANKKHVIRRIKQKFFKIIDEAGIKNINSILEKLYDDA